MLEVVGLAAGYLGERVIDGIDVEVRSGEAVAIVGSVFALILIPAQPPQQSDEAAEAADALNEAG